METGVVNCPVSVDRGAAVDRMPRPESGRDPRCRRRVDSPFLISVRAGRVVPAGRYFRSTPTVGPMPIGMYGRYACRRRNSSSLKEPSATQQVRRASWHAARPKSIPKAARCKSPPRERREHPRPRLARVEAQDKKHYLRGHDAKEDTAECGEVRRVAQRHAAPHHA